MKNNIKETNIRTVLGTVRSGKTTRLLKIIQSKIEENKLIVFVSEETTSKSLILLAHHNEYIDIDFHITIGLLKIFNMNEFLSFCNNKDKTYIDTLVIDNFDRYYVLTDGEKFLYEMTKYINDIIISRHVNRLGVKS